MSSSESPAVIQIRETTTRLGQPILDIKVLKSLLAAPLAAFGLLPPQCRHYNTSPISADINLSRHVPALQRVILDKIYPTWEHALAQDNEIILLEQYFCPDSFSCASFAAGQISLVAYSTILSMSMSSAAVSLLARLTREYPIDRLHSAVISTRNNTPYTRGEVTWEDCVRNLCAVPSKVANFVGRDGDMPDVLEHQTYFANLSIRCEHLVQSLSVNPSKGAVDDIAYILVKLVNLGIFPPTLPTLRSQPSFFQANILRIRAKLGDDAYSRLWNRIFSSISNASALRAIVTSCVSTLDKPSPVLSNQDVVRSRVKKEALVLRRLFGYFTEDNDDLWPCVWAVIQGRDWDEGYARIFVCWAADEGKQSNVKSLEALVDKTADFWSSSEHISHSLLSRHRYITALFLLLVSYLPRSSSKPVSLAMSPVLVSGVSGYISHMDQSVRRCGMLVAEVVAQRAGKKLDFGDWEGEDHGKPWARQLRSLLEACDMDVKDLPNEEPPEDVAGSEPAITDNQKPKKEEIKRATAAAPREVDSDDESLVGYASDASSRSASPTPSEMEEMEKVPTLGVGKKKIPRPVYLAQLGEMLRSRSGVGPKDEEEEANKIEIALDCAEELIRRKKDYGTELEENAVNIGYGLVGLQDNFELPNFSEKRQRAVTALVACCPRKAAPALIEEFFKNQYSADQRYVIMNALALAARELASLPIPESSKPLPIGKAPFASKTLPGPLHQRYIQNQATTTVEHLSAALSQAAIQSTQEVNADKVPELVRERRLRIRPSSKINEVAGSKNPAAAFSQAPAGTPTTFTEVATEFFIMPLINRFWLFLRDEQTREVRTEHHEALHRYRGAGTGLILNALILAQLLRTLSILVHAAQNALEWLAIVAPEALEVSVTVGTRPMSLVENQNSRDDDDDSGKGKDASILTASLELALVILDGSLERDSGRSLSLEHTMLLLGAKEWAETIFEQLEKGVRVEGGGGMQEVALKRAAAGVLLKLEEIISKWRQSMIDMR